MISEKKYTTLLIQSLMILLPLFSFSQDKNSFEVYGFILTDGGYNFNSIDPDWFDVMRPTKLPKYKNQFGPPVIFLLVYGKQDLV